MLGQQVVSAMAECPLQHFLPTIAMAECGLWRGSYEDVPVGGILLAARPNNQRAHIIAILLHRMSVVLLKGGGSCLRLPINQIWCGHIAGYPYDGSSGLVVVRHYQSDWTTRAGTPTAIECAGIDFVTTAPAPTMVPSPTS